MTTLIDELEQAADDADILARMVATMGHAAEVIGVTARARSLRQRAAWVRELEAELRHSVDVGNAFAGICLVQIQRLTGPIPSETAPAIAAAIDKTFEQDAGLLRRLADSPRPTPVQEAARMWREGDAGAKPELLPCPFCGGVAAPPTHMPLGSFQAAECTKCGARGGFAQSLPNSYATWNRRTAPPAYPPDHAASWEKRYLGSWQDATGAEWCTQPLHYSTHVHAVKLFSPAFEWGQAGACQECWEAGRRSIEDPDPAAPPVVPGEPRGCPVYDRTACIGGQYCPHRENPRAGLPPADSTGAEPGTGKG